jgi:hypothetical protein
MRTILAIAALFAVSACQSGGGYDGPPPMMYGPPPFQVWTPAPPPRAPLFGPTLMCSRLGNFINCY